MPGLSRPLVLSDCWITRGAEMTNRLNEPTDYAWIPVIAPIVGGIVGACHYSAVGIPSCATARS